VASDVRATRLPNGHLHVRLRNGSRQYEFALESLGNPRAAKGYLLVGEDSEASSIEVVADLEKDEICIGNMCFRANMQAVRELMQRAGPPMTRDEASRELGVPVRRVDEHIEAGDLVIVDRDQRNRVLIGAAGVLRLKGVDMETHDTMTYDEAAKYLGLAKATLAGRVKRGDLVQARKGIDMATARKQGISPQPPLLTRESVEAFKGTELHERALEYAKRAAKRLVTQAGKRAAAAQEAAASPPVETEQSHETSAPVTRLVPKSAKATGPDLIDLQLALLDGMAMGLEHEYMMGALGRLRELIGKELP
jgi:hypothetical protein